MAGKKFRWLGVAGFEFDFDGEVLITDPYLSRISRFNNFFGKVRPKTEYIASVIRKCDHIFVTHPHFDHLMDVPAVMLHTGAAAYGSDFSCRLLGLLGADQGKTHLICEGDIVKAGGYTVEVFPTAHGKIPGYGPGELKKNLSTPLKAIEYAMDRCFSFRIEHSGVSVLQISSMTATDLPESDILLIGTLFGEDHYKKLLQSAKPKTVIPSHWDDMWRPLSKKIRPCITPPSWALPPVKKVNLERFTETIRRVSSKTRMFVPEVLKYYDVRELIKRG